MARGRGLILAKSENPFHSRLYGPVEGMGRICSQAFLYKFWGPESVSALKEVLLLLLPGDVWHGRTSQLGQLLNSANHLNLTIDWPVGHCVGHFPSLVCTIESLADTCIHSGFR